MRTRHEEIEVVNMIAEARAVIPGPVKLALISGMGVVRGVVHHGNEASCPVCGWSFRRFLTFRGRADAQCPRCLSLERHRGMVEVCRDEIGLFERAARVLHVAPERMLARRLRTNPRLEYVSGDIEAGRADMVLDLTAIDAPAGSFDVVLCSHVLEHIVDDARALSEIRRVLKEDGVALLVVPHDPGRDAVYEDPTITSPAGRERAFGQFDHVRWYSLEGFLGRVRAAGFDVELLSPAGAGARGSWTPEDVAVLARPA